VVAALSFLALRGNPGAFDAAVHQARAHRARSKWRPSCAGWWPVARRRPASGPFGLRVLPQVSAPAIHAARMLQDVVTGE